MFLSCSLFPSMSSIIFHAFVVFILQQVFLSVKPTLKKSQQKIKHMQNLMYDFVLHKLTYFSQDHDTLSWHISNQMPLKSFIPCTSIFRF